MITIDFLLIIFILGACICANDCASHKRYNDLKSELRDIKMMVGDDKRWK